MKKLSMLVMAIALSIVSSQSFAFGYGYGKGHDNGHKGKFGHHQTKFEKKKHKFKNKCKPGKEVTNVPEMDAAGTGLAFALAGGLVLVMRERRNAKRA